MDPAASVVSWRLMIIPISTSGWFTIDVSGWFVESGGAGGMRLS
jgi:hypothetical protein